LCATTDARTEQEQSHYPNVQEDEEIFPSEYDVDDSAVTCQEARGTWRRDKSDFTVKICIVR
jgi:hypothetical protein